MFIRYLVMDVTNEFQGDPCCTKVAPNRPSMPSTTSVTRSCFSAALVLQLLAGCERPYSSVEPTALPPERSATGVSRVLSWVLGDRTRGVPTPRGRSLGLLLVDRDGKEPDSRPWGGYCALGLRSVFPIPGISNVVYVADSDGMLWRYVGPNGVRLSTTANAPPAEHILGIQGMTSPLRILIEELDEHQLWILEVADAKAEIVSFDKISANDLSRDPSVLFSKFYVPHCHEHGRNCLRISTLDGNTSLGYERIMGGEINQIRSLHPMTMDAVYAEPYSKQIYLLTAEACPTVAPEFGK